MITGYSYTRFSTPAQQKGDSMRRQLAKAERWAQLRGVTLDTSLRDLGTSAYKGKHRTKGALAGFLSKIDAGEIKPGSFLIVENIDRLSRENPWDAMGMMMDIINADIIVISLIDDMEYSRERLRRHPDLMVTLQASFTKGHRESADKADRLQEVWAEKRAQIVAGGRKKLTRQGPGWLRLVPDDQSEPLVGDWDFTAHAATGRQIFQWCIEGLGKEAIACKLNKMRIPTFKHGDGWQDSSVLLLLTDRRVIGELQLYTKVGDQGRRPVGEPVEGYFATASGETLVTQETFYLAQAAIARRYTGASVGRRDKVPNFFVGLAQCECGRNMEYRDKRNKRNPSGKNVYLICSGAQRKHACSNNHHYTYANTEAAVLDWVTDIRLPDEEANRAGVAGIKLTAKIAERDDLKRRIREVMDQWEMTTVQYIKSELLRSAERNGRSLELVEADIGDLQRTVECTKRSVLDDRRSGVSEARAELAKLIGEPLFEARAKLAAALRQVIDHVEFEPSGAFTVFLHGSVKAYRFTAKGFSHVIDVNDSSWMRLPTTAQKRALASDARIECVA